MLWPQSVKTLPNTDSGLSNYTSAWQLNAAAAKEQVLLMCHYIIVTPVH